MTIHGSDRSLTTSTTRVATPMSDPKMGLKLLATTRYHFCSLFGSEDGTWLKTR